MRKSWLQGMIVQKPTFTKLRSAGKKLRNNFLDKMINGLFSGSSTQLVLQALGNQKASKDELDEIQKYLDNLKTR